MKISDLKPIHFRSYFKGLLEKKEIKLLMLGLVGAGKRTILYKLRLTENNKPISTIGFNVETLEYKNNIYSCNNTKREGLKNLNIKDI